MTPLSTTSWAVAQERPETLVTTALQALERDGIRLQDQPPAARALAEAVARGEFSGAVLFCTDPALACCVANKVKGIRAAALFTVAQAARTAKTLTPNLIAVEMPGRTFFEVRQIVRTICQAGTCPPDCARTLEELERHAHR